VHDKKFGLKVLIGIVLGIFVGIVLLRQMPVGVQPGDVFEATTTSGQTVKVTIPSGKDAVLPELSKGEGVQFTAPVAILGAPTSDVPRLLSESSGTEFQSAKLDKRGKVTIRPALTETIFVVGEVFLRLLRMLVIPLVIATVLVGIASLGDLRKIGKIGGITTLWYLLTMSIAVLVGVIYVDLIKPGRGLAEEWSEDAQTMALTEMTPTEMLLKVIPENPIKAIAEMDIVGILFFIIFLSIAMLKLGKRRVAPVFNFFEGLNDIIRVLVGWVLKLAPVGVGCLIAHTIGTQDFEFMKTLLDSLWRFAMCVTLGLVTHFLILLVLAWWIGKTNPIKFLSCFGPAMATAFGSSSSSATLPVTMSCVQKMGVSRRISNFVLPVGATLNMDGTALFEAVAVIFFAQAFGFQLEFGAKLLVAVTSVVAAMGAAGIPSAGLVTMTLVLSAAGLPTNQMQVLWAIDRPLDMMRTVVNITGDAVTATVVQARLPEIRQDEDELYEEYEEVEPEASRDEPA